MLEQTIRHYFPGRSSEVNCARQIHDFLDDTRLEQRFRRSAAEMQRLLLPDWVNIPQKGLVAIGNHRPGSELSGDSYDVIALENGSCFFFAGRIGGEGIGPAIQTGVIQSLTRHLVGNGGNLSIEMFLNELKGRLRALFGSGLQLRCAGAIIDQAANRLTYANAGLPGLWLIDRAGRKTGTLNDCGELPFPTGMMLLAATVELAPGALKELAARPPAFEVIPYCLKPDAAATAKNGSLLAGIFRPEKNAEKRCVCQTVPQNFSRCYAVAAALADEVETATHNRMPAMKVELVLNEFLNNILIHGYRRELRLTPKIMIRLTIEPHRVEIAFFDRGIEWHYRPPAKTLRELDEQDYFHFDLDIGRGMMIIREIADSIERSRHDGLNQTVITLHC